MGIVFDFCALKDCVFFLDFVYGSYTQPRQTTVYNFGSRASRKKLLVLRQITAASTVPVAITSIT